MHAGLFRLTPLLTFLFLCGTAPLEAQLQREEGATYLEDFQKRPFRVTLKSPTQVSYDAALTRYLGTLRAPQQVELIAFTGTVARIKGIAGQGQVAGWVPLDALPDLAPAQLDELRKAGERATLVKDLIARKEIAVGMTTDEVQQSLGRPKRKSSRVDRTESEEVWEYIRYQNVPQTVTQRDETGRYYNTTIMVRVPSGQMAVIFRKGIVERIDKTEGTMEPDPTGIAVPPITIQY